MKSKIKIFLCVEAAMLLIVVAVTYNLFNVLCRKYSNSSGAVGRRYVNAYIDELNINGYCTENGIAPYSEKSPGEYISECINTFRNNSESSGLCEGTYIIAKCYDKDNKVVAEAGDIIELFFQTEKGRKQTFINPDCYFTPEQMQKIYNFQEKYFGIEVTKVEGYYEGEAFIPTAIEVKNNMEGNEKERIEYPTEKETITYTSDTEGLSIYGTFLRTQAKKRPVTYHGDGLVGVLDYLVEKYEASRAREIQLYNEAQFTECGIEGKAGVSAQWLKGTSGDAQTHEFTYKQETYRLVYSYMMDCNYIGLMDSWFTLVLARIIHFLQIAAIIISILLYQIFKKKRQLDYAKVVLTNGVAHELKTPLAVIKNYGECIVEKVNPGKDEYYLSSILKEADQMNDKIVELLNYTRFSNEEYKLKKDLFAVDELVDEVLREKAQVINHKKLTVTVSCKGSMEAKCDGPLIKMVIENYLSNAIHYTPEGRTIKITLQEERHWLGKRIACKVYNPGSYLSMEQMHYIWEVFYRGDKARNRKSGSTGFGLAICKHIIKLHKGRYGCVSKEQGIEFYFRLPTK